MFHNNYNREGESKILFLFCLLFVNQCLMRLIRFISLYLPQEVFDRDRFKFDDKMGHAFLNLQPLTSALKLKRALQLTTGETKLRKVAPDSDNCLLADSFITYTNGEIIMDVRLRLCDVESGEVFVTVKWIDHPTTPIHVRKR